MKSAIPDEPKQAAQDAVTAAKDNLPEPPKDVPNPFQNLFSGAHFLMIVVIICSLFAHSSSYGQPLIRVVSLDVAFRILQSWFSAQRCLHAGDNKPKEAAQDAASSAKDSLPEAPSNPFQGFFSGKAASQFLAKQNCLQGLALSQRRVTTHALLVQLHGALRLLR